METQQPAQWKTQQPAQWKTQQPASPLPLAAALLSPTQDQRTHTPSWPLFRSSHARVPKHSRIMPSFPLTAQPELPGLAAVLTAVQRHRATTAVVDD